MSIPRDLASERTLPCVFVAAVPESSNEVAGDDSDTLITKYDFIDDFEFYHCIIITNTHTHTHTQCVFHIIRLRLIIFHTPKFFNGDFHFNFFL